MRAIQLLFAAVILLMAIVQLVGIDALPNTDAAKTETAEYESVNPIRRRPIRVLLTDDEKYLLVANRAAGSISVLDVVNAKVTNETPVAVQLSELAKWRENSMLTLDAEAGELKCLELGDEAKLETVWSIKTVGRPHCLWVSQQSDEDSAACFVGGLWSRQLAKIELPARKQSAIDGAKEPKQTHRVDLPFAVGQILPLDNGKAILAVDRFGSRWATFSADNLTPIHHGDIGSKRICSISPFIPSGQRAQSDYPRVAVVCQPLNRLAQAIRNDVHWGLMVANEVLLKDERWFLEADWRESRRSNIPLGGAGEAKGDPERTAFHSNGDVAIPIGGMNEIAIGNLTQRSFAYVGTGSRPIDACFSKDGSTVYVANHLDDSVSFVDVKDSEVKHVVKLGEMPELTAVDRGERLFHSGKLSHDGWMTCNSCHVEGHTSGFLNDNFSDQSFGAPKRVLSLLGHGETAPFAWNGSAATIEDQVRSSIEVTMQCDFKPTDEQITDLAAFVRQLPAPVPLSVARFANPADAGRNAELQKRVEAGRALFADLGCVSCHKPPTYTSADLQNVGLEDELGKNEFNPPSLIGVSQRESLFHDARYRNLRELFEESKHQLDRELTDAELQSLLSFLNQL